MFRRIEQNSLQAFYKRFSGPARALSPEPAGADAWRATTYGHGVLQTNPHGSARSGELWRSKRRAATLVGRDRHDRLDQRRIPGPPGAARRPLFDRARARARRYG